MKVYRLEFETLKVEDDKEEWQERKLMYTDMSVIARYLVDINEDGEKYRNVKFFIGELEEAPYVDINTIKTIFL